MFRRMMIVTMSAGLLLISSAISIADGDNKELAAKLEKILPGAKIDAVRDAPITGFHEVAIGANVFYISKDRKHIFVGDVIDGATRINLTDNRRYELINGIIKSVPTDSMIVMAAKDTKRHITVFTDVDCPYCAKFHLEVPKLSQAGVEVRYLMYPRAGVGSPSYKKMVSVWCSDDKLKQIGIAKAGGKVADKSCENPVAQHLALGRQVGIQGTPAIVLDNGKMIPGYIPASRLLPALGLAQQKNNPEKAQVKTPG